MAWNKASPLSSFQMMDDATDVRIAAQQVLLTAECSTSNLKKEEIQAIRILRSDKSVVILPADKGNVTVKMDRDNYDHKIDSLLSDQTYFRLRCDHTKKIERRVQNHLKALADRGKIEPETYRKLNPSQTKPPLSYLYGQPKIHKPDLSYPPYSLCPYQTPMYPIPTSVTYYFFFFPNTSIHDFSSGITVGANKKFTFCFRSTVVLRCEPFRSVFTESSVFAEVRLLIQQLLACARSG